MTEPLGLDSLDFYLTYPSKEDEAEKAAKMFARLQFLWENREKICERWEADSEANQWGIGENSSPYFVDYIDKLIEEAAAAQAVPLQLVAKVDRVLVKWDADMIGETPPVCDDPSQHPACLEVIEILDGEDPKTLYRRTA
jgi:hypothetical protein